MTTIAWDGKTLASDSRMTLDGYIITDKSIKLYKINNISYLGDILIAVGLGGCCSDLDKFIAYIHSEDFPATNIDHKASGIVIGKYFVYTIENDTGFLVRINKKEKIAEGSGMMFALSAMHLGKNAKEAVKHAIKFDSGSGGRVQTMEINNEI